MYINGESWLGVNLISRWGIVQLVFEFNLFIVFLQFPAKYFFWVLTYINLQLNFSSSSQSRFWYPGESKFLLLMVHFLSQAYVFMGCFT